MFLRFVQLPALTALTLAPAALSAQEEPDADKPVIVVTGEGLEETPAAPAYSTEVLTRDQLMAAPSGRIEDALSSVAGFQQFRRSDSRSANPSAQGVTLRALGGNASSRALILLDGVPLADPFFGYIPFSAIVPERLSAARVTRGGGSGPFGAGALAGVIELTSANASDLGNFSGTLVANDRAETEASATLAQELGAGFAAISGRWDRGQGFFTTPLDQRVPASARAAFDSWSVQVRAVAPVNDVIELQARGLVYDDHRTLRFDGADSSSSGQDASLRLVDRGHWQFDALAYVQSRNFSNVVVSSTRFVPVLDQRNTPSTGLGGKVEVRPPVGGGHVMRIGLDYRRSEGELFENAIDAVTGEITERRNAGGVNSDLGLFIEDDFTFGALTITGGVRADRYTVRGGFFSVTDGDDGSGSTDIFPDRSGWETSFRGGALVRLSDAVSVRAVAYTGLRLPTLNELYRPFTVFPVTTLANAELQNERLEGYEAGVDLTPVEGFSLSVTAFDNRVEDAIANVTIGPNLRQRQNIDAIDARGIESSVGLKLGLFSLDGSLAWTDAEARGSGPAQALDGMRPSQTPRWAGSATVSIAPQKDWLLSATVRHVGRQFEDDLETDVLPAATTLDAFLKIPLRNELALLLRGENLIRETVVTRNQGGSIDLGTPCTLWAGVRLSL